AGAVLATPPGFPRTAALFFSLLGLLLVFCLTTIGTGAFLLSRLGTRPQEVSFEREPDAAVAPPLAAGVSAPPSTSEAWRAEPATAAAWAAPTPGTARAARSRATSPAPSDRRSRRSSGPRRTPIAAAP